MNETFLLIGKRHTGKSVGVINIMNHLYTQRLIDGAVVISGSEKANGFYQQYIPAQYVHMDYSQTVMDEIFRVQEYNMALFKEREINHVPRLACVLDDLAADSKLFYDMTINKSFMNGRHYHITMFFTSQYPKSVNPKIRSNADWIFIFKLLSKNQYDMIYKEYGGTMDKDVFYEMLDKCTDGYSCLVINQKTNSKNPYDIYFKYTFQYPLPNLHIGSAEEWQQAQELENKQREDTIRNYDGRSGIDIPVDKFKLEDLLGEQQGLASVLNYYTK
jgi:ABC-type dipeptide/oligopeptide/nickel transport system ATPase component